MIVIFDCYCFPGNRVMHITTGLFQFHEGISLEMAGNFNTQNRLLGMITIIPRPHRKIQISRFLVALIRALCVITATACFDREYQRR